MKEQTIAPPIDTPADDIADSGIVFGKCPWCGKPLRPRDILTDEPKAPPVGQGKQSRAICLPGCLNIIEYVGNGEWKKVACN